MARKFVKATGLHNIFNTSGSTLDITSIKESVQSKVNQTTIVFLTASEDAIYGYPDGSKYIWTMNTLYPTNSYDEIIEQNEEVIATIISKLNYTIGFDSSANLVWSEESGLTADTIKAAIEQVSRKSGVTINDSSVNIAETWSSQKISDELNNIDIETIQINDSSIDSSTVWSSQKVNNEIQTVKGLPYLKFTANTAGSTIALSNNNGNAPDIKYSRDGINWTQWDYSAITLTNAGDYIYVKGDNSQGFSSSSSKYSRFTMSGSIAGSGNIMSLIDNGECQTLTIPCKYCFLCLFSNCSSLTSAPELPATTLATQCYDSMFQYCTSLTSGPELPATTLADYCYYYMFSGCSSLTGAPKLPATTLAASCYSQMFRNCTSLTSAPELPATTLPRDCYFSMFYNCSSLTSAPKLPATTLAVSCYYYMFNGCTSLTSAPELPATTLADHCYYNMFRGCTSLTNVSKLPATTLASSCYKEMFYGCISLTNAPELPATTLVYECYQNMFYKCSKLSYIKCLATIGLNQNYTTTNWLSAVASTGTFIKDPNATWQVGSSGIPSGWITVNQCVASGINSHAEGNGTIASDDGAHAEGVFTESSGLYDMDSDHPKYGHSAAHTEGYKTTASAFAAHAEGDTTTANGYASHAEGKETEASGHNSHASGSNTIASGNNSHTEGHNTYAIGRSSHAEGIYTYAKETASHAEGYYTSANGNYSHAEGAHTHTNNESSHAEGLYTEADGQASHAEGHHTYTSSNYSHAEGSHTYANGQSSHAEGHYTETYGDGSHAEGSGSVANGYYSHAEGDHSHAEGDHSHAEGHRTISYGSNSHAEGCYTESSGMYSHTEGSYTITSNEAEHAGGKYNLSNTGTLNSIGIGTSSTDRKNAFEVMDNGDTFIYGVGNYDGTNINATNTKGERLPASIQEVMPIYDKEKRSVCFQHNETDNSLNEAQSDYSFVIGYNNKAIREETDEGGLTLQSANTFIGGMDNRAYHSNCIVFGEGLFTQFGNTFVLGKYNSIVSNQDGWGDTVLGIVGDGYKDSAGNATGRNVLLLQGGGDPALHCRGGFKNNASWINDFGEYFEWLDGNPENEDRIGYMVQLNGDKIELATSLEKCIGVISGTTGFIGGVCAFEWHNKFLHDKWGREIIGEDGNPIINPDYNPDLEYIPRELRKEWDVVGLIGQVVTRQDGTLKVGGYAGCSNGIATNATSGFKVLKIIDNETAIILVK